MSLREAAQQALETLQNVITAHGYEGGAPVRARDALRAALAEDALERMSEDERRLGIQMQPVLEPVAWMHVPHPDNGLRPVVSLSQQRESSLYGASVPLFIKEQL